jgi:hypothetical protein
LRGFARQRLIDFPLPFWNLGHTLPFWVLAYLLI